MTKDRFFPGAPGPDDHQSNTQPASGRAATPSVVAQCAKLHQALTAYSAAVADGLEHIDRSDSLDHPAIRRFEQATSALTFALDATSNCAAGTLEDLRLKQVAFAPCLAFCRENPTILEGVKNGLLRDIGQVAGKAPASEPSRKFPMIPFPPSWSVRFKPRPNGALP